MITLDSIRQSIEVKYANYEIDLGDGHTVSLCNPLRLDKAKRSELLKFEEKLDAADGVEEQLELLRDLVKTVATQPSEANHFLKVVGNGADADVILMEVVNTYMSNQQVGEASPSGI